VGRWGGLEEGCQGHVAEEQAERQEVGEVKRYQINDFRAMRAILTQPFYTVFEGVAHPYKDNLVKFGGRTHIVRQLPEVTKSIDAVKATAPS
jgi:hypothetical protein